MTSCHHDHNNGHTHDHTQDLTDDPIGGQRTDDHATSVRLLWALSVIAVFMVIEIIGGVLSGSLALLADAAHMFTDALALGLAAVAQRIAARPATPRLHFGYRRAQVLAAFANGVFMFSLLFLIFGEAVRRFFNPITIESGLMFWVAIAGLFANAVAFMILHRPEERNLNMRGAQLHVLADLVGSIAAIAAAIIIGLTGFMRIDPIVSLIAVALIGVYAFKLITKTSHILLEGAPDNIDIEKLARDVASAAPEISDVHNVRIWQITPEHPRAMMHICVEEAGSAAIAMVRAKQMLEKKYNIRRTTIQVDVGGECPDHALDDDRVREAATVQKAHAPLQSGAAHLVSTPSPLAATTSE